MELKGLKRITLTNLATGKEIDLTPYVEELRYDRLPRLFDRFPVKIDPTLPPGVIHMEASSPTELPRVTMEVRQWRIADPLHEPTDEQIAQAQAAIDRVFSRAFHAQAFGSFAPEAMQAQIEEHRERERKLLEWQWTPPMNVGGLGPFGRWYGDLLTDWMNDPAFTKRPARVRPPRRAARRAHSRKVKNR